MLGKLINLVSILFYLLVNSVEVFLNYHPSARRLLHGPTLMASLALPPTHPKFPSDALLHAICACATFHTVATPAESKFNIFPTGE